MAATRTKTYSPISFIVVYRKPAKHDDQPNKHYNKNWNLMTRNYNNNFPQHVLMYIIMLING